MLIAIDGIDGAGKTTLAEGLAALLCGLNAIIEKEPTDRSFWGRRLRQSAKAGRLPRDQETDYFHKDRIEHLREQIEPALAEGRVVILDRYVDSTLAFQTRNPAEADKLYMRFLPEIRVPDVTFILDCPVETGLGRIRRARGVLSEFEKSKTLNLAKRIYKSRRGPNYVHLNASGDAESTLAQAVRVLADRFPEIASYLVSSRDRDQCKQARAVI